MTGIESDVRVEPDLRDVPDARVGSWTAASLAAAFVAEQPTLSQSPANRSTVSPGQQRLFRWLLVLMFTVYIGGAVIYFVWSGQSFRPDSWALFLLVAALLMGRAGPFLRDWVPFVLVIFGYEFLRGVAGEFVTGGERVGTRERWELPQVQVENLVAFDKVLMFGHEAVATLQGWLYTSGQPRWWDYLAVIVYTLHFAVPCVFAFLLWIKRREWFWQFTLSFCLMTYSAFLAFLLYPAAPPWLANSWGVVEGLGWPAGSVTENIGYAPIREFDTMSIWQNTSPHPVAAMPSLHAAFPWLVLLFAVKVFGWKGLWFLVYNLALWFSVIYLANHWIVDVLAGMAWATVAFVVVDWSWRRMEQRDIALPPALMRAVSAVTTPLAKVLGPIWHAPGKARAWIRGQLEGTG